MATTEVHMLMVHRVGDDSDCIATYAGWTEDEAWEAFLNDGREEAADLREHYATEEYEQQMTDYASREAFAMVYGDNDVFIRCDVFHLPA